VWTICPLKGLSEGALCQDFCEMALVFRAGMDAADGGQVGLGGFGGANEVNF
jgi:hypothetical protein